MTSDKEEHIAVVVCDTPIESLEAEFGDFGDNCSELLISGGVEIRTKKYQVCFKEDSPQNRKEMEDNIQQLKEGIVNKNIKGVLLTGSRSDAFATNVWWINLLDEFIVNVLFKTNLPIVGVCFGHQILAKNLAAKVGRNLPQVGWELGLTNIQFDAKLASTFPFNQFEELFDECNLIEFHQDIVYDLPPDFHNIGSTAKCEVQGLFRYDDTAKILTFQGHPEFTSKFSIDHLIEMKDEGRITKQQCHDAVHSIESRKNNGPDIGRLMAAFIKGEQ